MALLRAGFTGKDDARWEHFAESGQPQVVDISTVHTSPLAEEPEAQVASHLQQLQKAITDGDAALARALASRLEAFCPRADANSLGDKAEVMDMFCGIGGAVAGFAEHFNTIHFADAKSNRVDMCREMHRAAGIQGCSEVHTSTVDTPFSATMQIALEAGSLWW
jgi:hypothetical protein